MKMSTVVLNRLHTWSFFVCLAFVALAGLSGCATPPTAGGESEIVTDSDEPEVRKRARLRLDLAVGYFEQGKTTVALDEIKQALATDPGYADAYNVRGLIYMRLNDFGLADESFRRAIALSPRDGNIQHNYGWMLCQQTRYPEALQMFTQAIANPSYTGRAKTWMAQGLCQMRAGQRAEAEYSLGKSFELDAANPIATYNLAALIFQRGDFVRSQFYIRRLNSSQFANAESLWLGIKVERRLGNMPEVEQLASQLRSRFPTSNEAELLKRGVFDE